MWVSKYNVTVLKISMSERREVFQLSITLKCAYTYCASHSQNKVYYSMHWETYNPNCKEQTATWIESSFTQPSLIATFYF